MADMVEAAVKLHRNGIAMVAVSLGKEGSLLVCEDGIFRAKVPKIEATNTVGCGDSMIAGFALGLSEGLTMEECLRKAAAISVASALCEETGVFRMEDMQWAYERILIECIR
jgi:tagatose 6-phosphate kinase